MAMTDLEAKIAQQVREGVDRWMLGTERSQQHAIGISSLGHCSEYLRREMDGQVEEPTDANKMFLGTAVGDYLERVQQQIWPDAIFQATTTLELVGDQRKYNLVGHPDMFLRACPDFPGGLMIDNKAPGGLRWVKNKATADQGYQFQRHLYYAALHKEGRFGQDVDPSLGLVGNIYYDRTGEDPTPHVQIEPYDPDVLFAATYWLDEVVDHYIAGTEAQKEPPREMCEKTCGFFRECRLYDTDAEGRIDHPETLEAIRIYTESKAVEREAKKMAAAALIQLQGVEGHTPEWTLRWTQVNGGPVSYHRDTYMRLSITKKR